MDLGGPSRGGKKPLDTVINLIPFIDLMAVTIAFLIMTAVWTQVGRMQVGTSGQPSEAQDTPAVPLTVLITSSQLVMIYGGQRTELPDIDKLQAALTALKADRPEQDTVTVQAEDSVHYEQLVHVIDACLAARITGISVTPASG